MPPIGGWKTGVYRIHNSVNGKNYIGSGAGKKGAQKRINDHRKGLRAGTHYNKHLQAAWAKYGESAFIFEVIENCHPKLCIEREQFWIDHYQAANPDHGYNICKNAGNTRGITYSAESRAKISAKAKGRERSEETRENVRVAISEQWADPQFTDLQRRRLAGLERSRGKKNSAETRAKISAAMLARSEELAEAASKRFKGCTLSPEHRAKIARAGLGRKPSVITLLKMRGQKRTAETRANISAGLRKHHQKKRERGEC